MELGDLENYKGTYFSKRAMALDVNKEVFDYVFEKKSDYFMIDIADARADMLEKDGHYITVLNEVSANKESLYKDYGLDTYKTVHSSEITDEQWNRSIDEICSRLSAHYPPDKIIINKFFGVEDYVEQDEIKRFPNPRFKKYNELLNKLYARLEANLKGCEIIEFPNYVTADRFHKFGRYELHYHNYYYEYGAKAVEIIISESDDSKKQEKLKELKDVYECKFQLLRNELELKKIQKDFVSLGNVKNLSDKFNDNSVDVNDVIKTAQAITDINIYFEFLKTIQSKYLVICAIRDTPGGNLPDSALNKIHEFGFTKFSRELWRMYTGVSFRSEIFCDKLGEARELPVNYSNSELNISVSSNAWRKENKAEIVIDGVDYAVNMRGINIVVYDIDNKLLIDSVAYDCHPLQGVFRRKESLELLGGKNG